MEMDFTYWRIFFEPKKMTKEWNPIAEKMTKNDIF